MSKESEQLDNEYMKKLMKLRGGKKPVNAITIFTGEYEGLSGYFTFNNLLFDCLAFANITKNERKVFDYVIRHTTGYHRTSIAKNISGIARYTNLERRRVYDAYKGLLRRNMIFEQDPTTIHINFNPALWIDTPTSYKENYDKLEEKKRNKAQVARAFRR